jgi:hypothetical protein
LKLARYVANLITAQFTIEPTPPTEETPPEPYEVKGCRYRIKGLSGRDGECIRTTRMGNYQFKKYQHQILRYHGGYYVLLVMSGDIICRCRVINVDALQIPFNGVATKTISHATLDNWLP